MQKAGYPTRALWPGIAMAGLAVATILAPARAGALPEAGCGPGRVPIVIPVEQGVDVTLRFGTDLPPGTPEDAVFTLCAVYEDGSADCEEELPDPVARIDVRPGRRFHVVATSDGVAWSDPSYCYVASDARDVTGDGVVGYQDVFDVYQSYGTVVR